jgi:hypothetical protein
VTGLAWWWFVWWVRSGPDGVVGAGYCVGRWEAFSGILGTEGRVEDSYVSHPARRQPFAETNWGLQSRGGGVRSVTFRLEHVLCSTASSPEAPLITARHGVKLWRLYCANANGWLFAGRSCLVLLRAPKTSHNGGGTAGDRGGLR